jgi:hypothetical protein
MGTRHKRTVGRFQVEALEGRWAPGGLAGGVIQRHIGEEIPQVQVAPVAHGSKPSVNGGANAGVPFAGKGGVGGEF